MNYPEHQRMKAIADKSQSIGEFIEWLINKKNVHLGHYPTVCYHQDVDGSCALHQQVHRECPKNCEEYEEDQARFTEWSYNTQRLLAEFFEIDLKKIDAEKEQMLEEIRLRRKLKDICEE